MRIYEFIKGFLTSDYLNIRIDPKNIEHEKGDKKKTRQMWPELRNLQGQLKIFKSK